MERYFTKLKSMLPMDPDPTPPAESVSPAGDTNRPPPLSLLVGIVLAWVGVLISLLLLERHSGLRAFLCPARGGCEAVLASKYSTVRGLPLPLFGAAFYFSVMGLLLAVYAFPVRVRRLRLLDGALWMTVVGLTFSAGLMYLQFGVLHAFCPLCTLSALVMAGLLGAVARSGRVMATRDWGASRVVALALLVFAVMPAAILLTSGLGAPEPAGRRSWIDLSTARLAGSREAKVQLVVFSDFQCQFCQQLAPVVKRLRADFPQEVLIAFRYFPLEAHPRAFPAAVAAECAGEQGRFWEYHDQLFAEHGDLSDARLLALAGELGLDQERFAQCLRAEKSNRQVADSRDDAIKSGLEGVPVIFLNGRRIQGPLDYEHLARQVRELLPMSRPSQKTAPGQ
jgi:protein-disulfide isomerase